MTVTLPLQNQRWPKFRLLTRTDWGGTTSSGGGWQIQMMQSPSPRASGFILLNYSRCLLPQLGTAELMFRFGRFGDSMVGVSQEAAESLRQGNAWNPETDRLSGVPDLTGKELRIQAAYPNEKGNVEASAWRTVFWGTCEYQEDVGWGAAAIPSGDRIYHCIDAFARTKRWFLDRHGMTDGSEVYSPAAGHPGYNVAPQSPSVTSGNKGAADKLWDPSGDYSEVKTHTMPGAGLKWTDQETINNALAVARPRSQPLWTISGAAGALALMAGENPWPVDYGESVFSVVERICRRSRGKGAAFPTWTETSPLGPLTCTLKIFAQIGGGVTYYDPTAETEQSIPGATTDGTAVTVDLIGDHRFVPGSLRLGDPEQYRVDYLISYGERIEVLVTLEYNKSLEAGWNAGEQTDFLDLDPDKRTDQRWVPVFNLHRLIRGFNMQVSNGNEGSLESADYKCAANGALTTTTVAGMNKNYLTTIEVMDDLPLFDGYDYTSAVARADEQTAAAYAGQPTRRPPLLMVRTASDRFLHHEQWSFAIQLKNTPDGFLLLCQDDLGTGQRQIGDVDDDDLGSVYDYEDLVLTVGVRLPNRVQVHNGSPSGRRHMRVYHPDVHLWVAAPTAIWDLDSDSSDSDGSPPKRGAATSLGGILRDDRAGLARDHAITCIWYDVPRVGEDRTPHLGASWSLKCCGDIPTATAYDGGGVVYPTCGQVVQYLYANGQKIELNTPVSTYTYDNESGVSSWVCDWMDLDHARK